MNQNYFKPKAKKLVNYFSISAKCFFWCNLAETIWVALETSLIAYALTVELKDACLITT